MNKRHYEHTLPNIRGSLSNTYKERTSCKTFAWNTTRSAAEAWRLHAKPARSSLATCPFLPVGLLKNECGAWLKNPVGRGVSFCFLFFSRPRLTERKRSASENRVNPFPRAGKKRSPGGSLPVPDFRR